MSGDPLVVYFNASLSDEADNRVLIATVPVDSPKSLKAVQLEEKILVCILIFSDLL